MTPSSEAPKNSFLRRLGKFFLAPGEFVCNRLGVEDEDSKYLLRMFVNLTVYGKLALLIFLPFL